MVVFVIEDDPMMAECIAWAAEKVSKVKAHIFHDAVAAASEIDQLKPSLIFLDVMLAGPNGFTLLNELVSYAEKIPVVIITSLDLSGENLVEYNVTKVLDKDNFLPQDIERIILKEQNAA